MKIWWWIDPLLATSLILLVIGIVVMYAALQCNSKILDITAVILVMPFAITIISILLNSLLAIFYKIWSPYF